MILIVRVLAVAATLALTSNCGLLSTHDSLKLRCIILILRLFATGGALVVISQCLGSTLGCVGFNIGISI